MERGTAVVGVVGLQHMPDMLGAAQQEHGPRPGKGKPDDVALFALRGLENAEHVGRSCGSSPTIGRPRCNGTTALDRRMSLASKHDVSSPLSPRHGYYSLLDDGDCPGLAGLIKASCPCCRCRSFLFLTQPPTSPGSACPGRHHALVLAFPAALPTSPLPASAMPFVISALLPDRSSCWS